MTVPRPVIRLLAGILILTSSLLPLGSTAQTGQTTESGAGSTAPSNTLTTTVATKTLSNGLKVVVVEDHAAAVVQTAMWYRTGSLDEQAGKTGLAHALEHMMFRGTQELSGGAIDDIGARLGAEVNANTAEDYTHFYFVLPANQLDLALHIEADRMRGLLLRASDWSLERGAVLSEIDTDNSQPVGKLVRDVRAAAYAGSPYALTALGERSDVVHASTTDLRAIYDRWYAPNNATLVVTGDVHADAVFADAQRRFGAIPARQLPAHRALPALPIAANVATVNESADFPYTVLDVAYRVPGDLDADNAALQLVANVMSNERSQFYRALVLSKLTLGYDAFVESGLHAGVFHVALFLTPGTDPKDARTALESTLAATRQNGVDPDLLAAAKVSAARQATFARDSITGLGDRYGYALGVEGRDPSVDDATYAAVDAPAATAAMIHYLSAPAAVGTLAPRKVGPSNGPSGSGSVANDNFSSRAPNGPIVMAPWAKAALEIPVRIASRVHPTAYTLPNGLRIMVQRVDTNPTVFINGSIDLSPSFDPIGKTGTGALASALLGYGGAKYDFDAERRIPDELGDDVSYGSNFRAHGLVGDLDRLLDLLADTVTAPTFPQQYVDLVSSQERATITQRDRDPETKAGIAFAKALYAPGDPVLRVETLNDLGAITRDDIVRYAQRYFRPDRATIVIAGDVDPTVVRDAVALHFGSWTNNGPRPTSKLPDIPATIASRQIIPAQRDEIGVRMGERGIARSNPDFYALNLVNEVLGAGGTFDTRLMSEIRAKRGLVYGVSSQLAAGRERGLFEIAFNAAPQNVPAAVAGVKAEVRRMTTTPVSATEWNRARTKLLASTVVSEESTAAIVARAENIAQNHLPTDYYATIAQRYGKLTPTDGLRAAKRHLNAATFAEVYVGTLPASTASSTTHHASH